MKIGIFTVSIPEFEPVRALEVAAAIGYNGLEWRVTLDKGDREKPSFWSGNRTSMTPDVLMECAPTLRSTAEKLGIEMPSLGAYTSCFDLETVENVFKAANAVGATAARVNTAGYNPEVSFAQQLRDNREQFAKVEQLAKRYKVKALIETHMGLLTPTVTTAVQVLEGLDPEYVGIMWDPGNQVEEGRERYHYAINAAGPYLAEVHVKNRATRPVNLKDGSLLWQCDNTPLAFGEVNWPAVIAELKNAKYDGWLMLEDFSTIQPVEERIKSNLDYLRGPCGVQ